MGNVNITATHPTTRTDGSPGQAVTWRVESKLASAPSTAWAAVGGPQPVAATGITQQNVANGEWQYRGFWKDSDGQESAPSLVATITVGAPSVPAPLNPGSLSLTQD
jgi:hypothetical protein